MSEPDLASSSWSADDSPYPDPNEILENKDGLSDAAALPLNSRDAQEQPSQLPASLNLLPLPDPQESVIADWHCNDGEDPKVQELIIALQRQAAHDLERHQRNWEQERQHLLAELAQAQAHSPNSTGREDPIVGNNTPATAEVASKAIERIRQLEQALDQALASLSELRFQLRDQQALETQLASTEEFTHIQQQAIAKLKLQLAQQQQALETQIIDTQERDQAYQELLAATEALAQGQQAELERLRVQIAHDRAEAHAYQHRLEKQLTDLQASLETQQQRELDLESQALAARSQVVSLEVQLEESHRQVGALQTNLSDRQANINRLTLQIEQAHLALQAQQELGITLSQTQSLASEQNTTISSLSQDLVTAHIKIEELETQVAKQVKLQARLQHACQELEAERDRYQARVTELEQRTAEMQEQILKQARQASEYEAAIQHWKDRSLTSYPHILELKEQLEQFLTNSSIDPNLAALLAELLLIIQPLATSESPEPEKPDTVAHPRFGKNLTVDLPAFLSRRRDSKT